MSAIEILGPIPYWTLTVMLLASSFPWTLNCVSITYSEIYAQVAELLRVKK